MKKYLSLILATLLFFGLASLSFAQTRQGSQQQIRIEATSEATATPEAGLTTRQRIRLENADQLLERVRERTSNPETGEQIRTMIERHEQAQTKLETAFQRMEERPAYLRFLIGPNYKNAGELRSELVQLRNEIRQLNQLKERVSTSETNEIQNSIEELETQAGNLETELNQKLSGFSLFGWLNRLLAGYQE